MERLPYIDEIAASVPADPHRTWEALTAVMRSGLSSASSAQFVRVLGATPARAFGEWATEGAAIPGFAVAATVPPERLELRGRHRFANYALIFEIDDTGEGSARVRARTYAEFPGFRGRAYRALVIGSRAHRVVVHRLLRRVAARARRPLG